MFPHVAVENAYLLDSVSVHTWIQADDVLEAFAHYSYSLSLQGRANEECMPSDLQVHLD